MSALFFVALRVVLQSRHYTLHLFSELGIIGKLSQDHLVGYALPAKQLMQVLGVDQS